MRRVVQPFGRVALDISPLRDSRAFRLLLLGQTVSLLLVAPLVSGTES